MQEKYIQDVLVRQSNLWPNYGCSIKGRVFRWEWEKEMKVGMLRGDDPRNYPCVRVSHDCKASWANVHVMVAECWIANDDPELKIEVNHIDGNKQNACVNNLEWCSNSENQIHKVNSGLSNSTKQIIQYDLQMNKINEFDSQTKASNELKISSSSISKCCLDNQKTAGGFIFKFA